MIIASHTIAGPSLFTPIDLPPFSEEVVEGGRELNTVSSDGEFVAITEYYSEPEEDAPDPKVHLVRVYSLRTGHELFDPIRFDSREKRWLGDHFFIDDDRQLVICEDVGDKTRLHVIELPSGQPVGEPHEFLGDFRIRGIGSNGLALVRRENPRGESIFPEHVMMYDTKTWKPVSQRIIPQSGNLSRAHLSPDGTRLVIGHGELWDTVNGTMLTEALIPNRKVSLVTFQQDSQALIAVSDDVASLSGANLYLYVNNQLRIIRLSKLVQSIPDDSVLAAWAGVLSGQRIDEAGGTISLTAKELDQAWEEINNAKHHEK